MPQTKQRATHTRSVKQAEKLLQTATKLELDIKVKTICGTELFNGDSVKVEVIHPTEEIHTELCIEIQKRLDGAKGHPKTNESSIVSLITFTKDDNSTTHALITGDAEAEDILKALENKQIQKFKYVEVPHHGAFTNYNKDKAKLKEFYEKVVSEVYLISTNGKKSYKHPDKEVIAAIVNSHNSRREKDPSLTTTIIFTEKQSKFENWPWLPVNDNGTGLIVKFIDKSNYHACTL